MATTKGTMLEEATQGMATTKGTMLQEDTQSMGMAIQQNLTITSLQLIYFI